MNDEEKKLFEIIKSTPIKGAEQLNTKEAIKMSQENAKLVLVTFGEQPNIELGTEAIEAVINALKEINEAREIILADGKITTGDFVGHPIEVLWEPAKAIWDVIQKKDLFIAQISQINFNECEELINSFAEKFNTVPDKLKLQISHVIKAAWHIGEIFKA
jgi:hypothetical protein